MERAESTIRDAGVTQAVEKAYAPAATGPVRTIMRTLCVVWPWAASRLATRLWFIPPARPRITEAHGILHASGMPLRLNFGKRSVRGWCWGKGERRILVAHGWSSHTGWMGNIIKELVGAGFQVYAFDAPLHGVSGAGSGDSKRTTMLEMRQMIDAAHAGYGPFYGLACHSGGCAAAVLALKGGMRVERMVMIAPMKDFGPYLAAFQETLGLSDRVQQEWTSQAARQHGFKWRDFDIAHMPDGFTPPQALIIHDADDQETPLAGSIAIQKAWAAHGAKHLITAGFGHRHVLKDPGVNHAAAAFLRQGSKR